MQSLTATQQNTGQAHIAIDGGANMVLQNDKNKELLQKKIKQKAEKLRGEREWVSEWVTGLRKTLEKHGCGRRNEGRKVRKEQASSAADLFVIL